VALGLPIGDTLLSMTRRAVRGAPLFRSDRGHIHHRLLALGFSHRQAVLMLYGLCILLGAIAVALTRASGLQTAAFLAGLLVLALLILSWVGYIKLGNTERLLGERKRNLVIRNRIRDVGERLRQATGLEQVWEAVQAAMQALEASCVSLKLVEERDGKKAERVYRLGFDEAGLDVFRARFSLLGERPDEGSVELGWTDGRAEIDRDTEIAIELLCEHVLAAVNRLRAASMAPEAGKVVQMRR
jgi:UDP-GlcNAc:undecaprenyl-phosphate GlcNAc-1-phosphate transferase